MIGRFGGLARSHIVSAGTLLSVAMLLIVAAVACAPQSAGQARLPGASQTGKLRSRIHPAASKAVRPAGQGRPAIVKVRRMRLADGAVMTVVSISGAVRFVLHCGSADPGAACRGKGLTAGPAIGPAERPWLIAAFNGGFKLSAGAGGYEQQGRIISPLKAGLASLVIYRSGAASIGVWDHGEPARGMAVYSVRQNLGLLVARGRPTPSASAGWGYWGGTVTGVDATARSALGQTADGGFVYVASVSARPPDLAEALVRAGAVVGMELDINQEWVQFDYARHPGGPLIKGIPSQWRPARQYLTGWTRDFIAVLAKT